jgi:hypothetical protein
MPVPAAAAAVTVGLFAALPALAQTSMDYGADYGMGYAQDIGLPSLPLQSILTGFLRALLGFVGFAMVLQIMYAGFLMMTHGGKVEAQEKAVAALTQSIVGFLIIMTASSAAHFVVNAVVNAQSRFIS